MNLHPFQTARDGYRIIAASVIHKDNRVDQLLLAHFLVGLAQGLGGVIRRHHYHHSLISIHIGTEPKSLVLILPHSHGGQKAKNPVIASGAAATPVPVAKQVLTRLFRTSRAKFMPNVLVLPACMHRIGTWLKAYSCRNV